MKIFFPNCYEDIENIFYPNDLLLTTLDYTLFLLYVLCRVACQLKRKFVLPT